MPVAIRDLVPHHPMRKLVAVVMIVMGGLAGIVATAETPPQEVFDAAKRRADGAADRLNATLMSRLTAALQEGGPARALRVCREIAQDVTREVGTGERLVIRRTSLRTRNPLNAPDPFERLWLERAEAAMKEGRPPEPIYEIVVSAGAPAVLRHLRPIVFPGGVCAQCHGATDQIPDEVRMFLREHYPEDRATGFKPGDLRGAISITVPIANTTRADPRDDMSHGAEGSLSGQ